MNTSDYSLRRSGQGAEKLLGELELEIMQVIWAQGRVTVREVLETLTPRRVLAYTTVMTIMGRLAEKGVLMTEKRGKTYFYRPAYSQEEFERQAVSRVVQSLLTDFGSELAINQFVERLSAVDPAQLARLAALANQVQGEQHDA